jgi:hypothetical protein
MPIIELVHDQIVPLSQGDILKGVSLFSTKKSWTEGGGEPERTNRGLALVLSRPCVAAHDEWVLVAAVEKYKNKPPGEFESYDEAKQFFIEVRDGLTTPDQLYLGQIPGYEGSFCGQLDSLHTIQIPKSGTAERQAFLAAARIASLNQEFAHDLHLRIFRAFASLGFDDHRWFSSDDLRALVAVADRDEAKHKVELLAVDAKLKVGQSQGFHHESEKKKLERERARLEEILAKLGEEIGPFREELAGRDRGGAGLPHSA